MSEPDTAGVVQAVPSSFYLYRPTNGLGVRRRILFYWLTSLGCAAAGYGLLWALLPGHRVFGAPYAMYLYHDAHPLAYIILCCGVFGPLAAFATEAFKRRGRWGRVGVVALLALATVGLSSPLGGMLWEWHDMRAGYFPADWARVLFLDGARDGLLLGWFIVLLSIPYNVLGLLVCYALLAAGARRFPPLADINPEITQRRR